ncbi:D-2-hydroxyacid dehydrogenase, partial [Actinomadura sp. DSM 109109]|nr:D-2-hydroxyacid dehydrogenase [Actinomadura lepetitiana]
MKAVLPALARPLVEPHLPAGLSVDWWQHAQEAKDMIAQADIAWVDMENSA